MGTREGPKASIDLSCFDCVHEDSESYAVQGDSGHDVYCTHGGQRKRIGDTTWKTPDWCPLREAALIALGRSLGLVGEPPARIEETPLHFNRPDHGPHVKADEDGCCAACGADCTEEICVCSSPLRGDQNSFDQTTRNERG